MQSTLRSSPQPRRRLLSKKRRPSSSKNKKRSRPPSKNNKKRSLSKLFSSMSLSRPHPSTFDGVGTKRKRDDTEDEDDDKFFPYIRDIPISSHRTFIKILIEAIVSDSLHLIHEHKDILIAITKRFLLFPDDTSSTNTDLHQEFTHNNPDIAMNLYNIIQRCYDIITTMLETAQQEDRITKDNFTFFISTYNLVDEFIMYAICNTKDISTCNLSLLQDPNTSLKLVKFYYDNILRSPVYYPREIQFPVTPKPWIYHLVWDAPWGNRTQFDRSHLRDMTNLCILEFKQVLSGIHYIIADALQDCPNLLSLSIPSDQIIGFNLSVPSSNRLQTLTCGLNHVLRIRQNGSLRNLRSLKTLRTLRLYRDTFTVSLHDMFMHIPQLESLTMEYFNYPLGTSLQPLTNLKQLYLPEYTYLVSHDFASLTKLESLSINKAFNVIFPPALSQLKQLLIIDNFTDTHQNSLQHLTNLRFLDIFLERGQALNKSLQHLSKLEILVINAVEPFGNSFDGLTSLHTIVLKGNYRFPLINSITNLPSLQEIHLHESYQHRNDLSPPRFTIYELDDYGFAPDSRYQKYLNDNEEFLL